MLQDGPVKDRLAMLEREAAASDLTQDAESRFGDASGITPCLPVNRASFGCNRQRSIFREVAFSSRPSSQLIFFTALLNCPSCALTGGSAVGCLNLLSKGWANILTSQDGSSDSLDNLCELFLAIKYGAVEV